MHTDTMKFEDIESSPVYRRFFDLVSALMGVSVRMIDTSGKISMRYARQKRPPNFCDMIRRSPAVNARCIACNRRHEKEAVRRRKGYVYRCHAGLYDIVVPLFDRGAHAATLITGQFLPSPHSDKAYAALRSRARTDIPDAVLRKAYQQSRYLPRQGREALADLIQFFCDHVNEVRFQIMDAARTRGRHEIALAKDLVHAQASSPIYLADAARSLGLSPAYFSSMFRKETGTAFTEYINGVRLQKAQRLLAGTDASIIAVAHECGFTAISNFNRLFRRYCGCTPLQYRKRHAALRARRQHTR